MNPKIIADTLPIPRDILRVSEQILVNITPQETRVAILEDGVVQELHIERSAVLGLVGNIYLGQVKRVLPGMQSAFVDIGLARAGFLHVGDLVEQRHAPHEEQRIERLIFEGQIIMVQVIKDPIGTKGARLSSQISLAGRLLVHFPQDDHIGISQRIASEGDRFSLKTRLSELIPENAPRGFIVRTSAETADDADLSADVAYLTKRWQEIQAQAKRLPPQAMLYEDLPLSVRILRDMVSDNTTSIVVDSTENYTKMQQFANDYVNSVADKLQRYTGERPLFEQHDVEEAITEALQRRVNLKSGCYLVIDQTEAMTTIDVNTGGFVGLRNFEETLFKTNLEATHALARELRLRNLGGIIIVDFIDMERDAHKETVLQEMAKALARDRTRVTLNGFTSLGLVEITRKRTRESLAQVLCEPCPTCLGLGKVRTTQTVCYDIQRQIVRESRQYQPKGFRILAAQSVVDLFLEEEAGNLAMLIDFINKPISLSVENTYTTEQFDIILM